MDIIIVPSESGEVIPLNKDDDDLPALQLQLSQRNLFHRSYDEEMQRSTSDENVKTHRSASELLARESSLSLTTQQETTIHLLTESESTNSIAGDKSEHSESYRSRRVLSVRKNRTLRQSVYCGCNSTAAQKTQVSPQLVSKCISGIVKEMILKNSHRAKSSIPSKYDPFNSPTTISDHNQLISVTKTPYSTAVITRLDEIVGFLSKMLVDGQIEYESAIISIIYMERIIKMSHGQFFVTDSNWKGALFICILIASKVWDEFHMTNREYTTLFYGLTIERINLLEITLLLVLDYKLWVFPSEYATYHFRIQESITKFEIEKRRRSSNGISESQSPSPKLGASPKLSSPKMMTNSPKLDQRIFTPSEMNRIIKGGQSSVLRIFPEQKEESDDGSNASGGPPLSQQRVSTPPPLQPSLPLSNSANSSANSSCSSTNSSPGGASSLPQPSATSTNIQSSPNATPTRLLTRFQHSVGRMVGNIFHPSHATVYAMGSSDSADGVIDRNRSQSGSGKAECKPSSSSLFFKPFVYRRTRSNTVLDSVQGDSECNSTGREKGPIDIKPMEEDL